LDTATNARVASFATASDRTIRNADVRMVWNLLDFGITYYQVKQEGNKILIADEARRKVVGQLLRDVRTAYWKAAIAQKMQPEIERILTEARKALDNSSLAQRKGLASPVKSLEYQKALLKLIDTLENVFNQMEQAKTQLSSLINEPLGHDYELDVPDEFPMDIADVPFCLPRMEELALLNKPEIRTEIYRKRISVAETRKATLRMLPGLELSSGENYSSNSFLHNKAWAAASAQVTWNIFNILSGPAAIKHSKANEAVADHRRMALQMAVLTKVRLSYRDYLHRRYQLGRASKLDSLETQLSGYIRNAAQKRAKSKLEMIQAEVSALNARLGRNNAYAALQDALGYVYDSMGIDPLGQGFNKTDLTDMRGQLASNLGTWTKAESAPFNWACYAPEREDQSYADANFRVPEKTIRQAIASSSQEIGSEDFVESVARRVVEELRGGRTAASRPASSDRQVKRPVNQTASALPLTSPISNTPQGGRKLSSVPFPSGAGSISPDAAAKLDNALEFLRDHPDLTLSLTGVSRNERTSGALVQAAYRYLVARGVNQKSLSLKQRVSSSAEGGSRGGRVDLYLTEGSVNWAGLR
ncbi:MAG: TolC family protein, partial [Mariprofundaceae bacterium]|nr:TolC family protein [Mariprofundaceae bacterium]